MSEGKPSPVTHVAKLMDSGMEQQGMTEQAELARLCQVDKSYLSRLKRGQIKHPSERVLSALAHALGQTPDDYRLALLADRGELPDWITNIEIENGVRLTSEDKQLLKRLVLKFVQARRNDTQL